MLGRFDARLLLAGVVAVSVACAGNSAGDTVGSDTDRSIRGADTVGYQPSGTGDTVQVGDTVFTRDTVARDTSDANAFQRGANMPDTAYMNRDTSSMQAAPPRDTTPRR